MLSFHKIVYWKEPYKSAAVLACIIALLLAFVIFSAVSVVSYVGLTLLAITFSFRTFSSVAATVQKTEQTNPFKEYLEKGVSLDRSKAREIVEDIVKYAEKFMNELRRLFFIENVADSLKFGIFLWILTFIGTWFSGALLILSGETRICNLIDPTFRPPNQQQLHCSPAFKRYTVEACK
ncbi:unnamed protein product [Soboliphyme baturini]|uniref:Reticulon-like protein n=1 Tax=Soboliphyme baturini TaxID=241478 RepID=A0A183IXZ7_9BILA|nr:unnamed protein product [Soboliphyme baturini]